MQCLGHKIIETAIMPLSNNSDAILSLNAPTKLKKLRFTGSVHYLKNSSRISHNFAFPQIPLLKTNNKLIWTIDRENKFNAIQTKIVEEK